MISLSATELWSAERCIDRWFTDWSLSETSSLCRRCKYLCCIEEQEGRPLFKVKVVEKGYDDLILTGPTPKGEPHLCTCTDRKWIHQTL